MTEPEDGRAAETGERSRTIHKFTSVFASGVSAGLLTGVLGRPGIMCGSRVERGENGGGMGMGRCKRRSARTYRHPPPPHPPIATPAPPPPVAAPKRWYAAHPPARMAVKISVSLAS